MRTHYGLCGLLLSAVCLLTSCLKDDEEEVALYDDTAITAFQITSGSLSYYPFSIDQVGGLIYNVDSLPYGTDATKLLVSCSTKNNGTVWIENLARDSVKYLLTTDSTDFTPSEGRYLRVYASNGSQDYKLYNVKVNVHQEDGDAATWDTWASDAAKAFEAVRLVAVGDSGLVALGLQGGATQVYSATIADGSQWELTATLGADAYKNAAAKGDTLFTLDGGELKASVAGGSFNAVATTGAASLSRLLGATSTEIYAYSTNGQMLVSKDNGLTWEADSLDASATLLPTDDIAFCASTFAYTPNTDLALLAGANDNGSATNAMAWTKIVEKAKTKKAAAWSHIDFTHDTEYPLPRLSNLAVLSYGGKLLALGGTGTGQSTATAFSTIYESRDGGLTWKASTSLALPSGFDKAATAFAAATDNHGHIWLLCGGTGQVWRGRLNKMGW